MKQIETEKIILKNEYEFFYNMFKDKAKAYENKHFDSVNVNPFTIQAASSAFSGEATPNSIAKAIAYPFALGTSLSTTFGSKTQEFIVTTIGDFASVVSGMDIEFIDAVDGRRKFCQIKSGPNTINKDDIETIENHFRQLRNLARTNHLDISANDPVVGVLYGSHDDLSGMYKKIENDGYNVYAGEEFWYHLTGIDDLYSKLIVQAQNAAKNANLKKSIDIMISNLEKDIKINSKLFGLK